MMQEVGEAGCRSMLPSVEPSSMLEMFTRLLRDCCSSF